MKEPAQPAHTPGPWFHGKASVYIKRENDNDLWVAECRTYEDAAFIVRAPELAADNLALKERNRQLEFFNNLRAEELKQSAEQAEQLKACREENEGLKANRTMCVSCGGSGKSFGALGPLKCGQCNGEGTVGHALLSNAERDALREDNKRLGEALLQTNTLRESEAKLRAALEWKSIQKEGTPEIDKQIVFAFENSDEDGWYMNLFNPLKDRIPSVYTHWREIELPAKAALSKPDA